MINYGFYKELNVSFGEILKQLPEKVKDQGFGIVSQIDMKEKFKEKLGIEFKEYTILGLCDPASAIKSIQTEQSIGLMLPCNMVVFEKDDKTVVSIIKPTIAMSMIENEKLESISRKVEERLKKIFDSIE
ncbi:MAG: DUF302 domain-containing protein [Candidatus Cloacimonetes bacterium]|nr:DUF302 domain-containing protein [Candidatus Cloacimonadota bacterium]